MDPSGSLELLRCDSAITSLAFSVAPKTAFFIHISLRLY